MRKRGFTLIELIVVMAIIAILLLLGVPKYKNYVQDAHLTKIKVNVKELESASMQYYIRNNDWPRLSDVAYTPEEITAFSEDILNNTGAVVTLDTDGDYYDVDYAKLSNYLKKPIDSINYILQNPVGSIYYLNDIKEQGKNRLSVLKPNLDDLIPIGSKVLEYKFTGKTNTDLNKSIIEDLSGNGFNGTLMNFAYTGTSGWNNDGLMLDGTDYVRLPLSANPYIKPKTNLTVTVEVSRDNWVVASEQCIVSNTQVGGWNFYLLNSRLGFKVHDGSKYVLVSIPADTLSFGKHIITGTFDGRFLKLYVDGVIGNTVDLGKQINIQYTYDNAVLIGADAGVGVIPDPAPLYFTGKIHSLSIYNQVLSDEAIALIGERK